MEFYASCPEGFESALADELKRLGLSHVRRLKGRATFEGELEEGYRACLWSRLASRVFAVLGRFEAQDADELYDSVYDIAWENIVRPGATIAITARGVTEQLRNTRFSALRAKDALCDRLAETTGRRADVDAADPDVHLCFRCVSVARASAWTFRATRCSSVCRPLRLVPARAHMCCAPTTPPWCWRRSAGPHCASAS
jgi:23S rRNA (guanine2445-N2)-methyltransferase / 23S rRNA (guanine2069-N7)-methyltransferase